MHYHHGRLLRNRPAYHSGRIVPFSYIVFTAIIPRVRNVSDMLNIFIIRKNDFSSLAQCPGIVDIGAINDQTPIGESPPIRGPYGCVFSIIINPSMMVLVSAKG